MSAAKRPGSALPDLHHKMCKKIVQLVKVIYDLNNKNDQQEYQMSSLVNAYESEISEIVQEASSRLNEYRLQIEAKQEEIKQLEHTVKQQQEQERAQVSEELEQTRKEAAAQTQNLNARVQQLLKEQEEMRVQFEERLKSMSSDSNHLETTHHATINSIKKANQEEIRILLEKKTKEIAGVIDGKDKEMQALAAFKDSEKEQALQTLQQQLNKATQDKISGINAQHAQDKQKLKDQFEEEVKKLKAEHQQRLDAEKDTFAMQLQSIQDQGKSVESTLGKHMKEMQARLQEAQEQVRNREDQVHELNITIEKLSQELAKARAHAQNIMADGEAQTRLLKEHIQTMTANYDALEKSKQEAASEFQDKLAHKDGIIEDMQQLQEMLQSQLDQFRSNIDALHSELQSLRQEREFALLQQKNSSEAERDYHQQVAKMREDFRKQKDDLQAEMLRQMERETSSSQKKLLSLKETFKQHHDDLKLTHQKQLEEVEKKHRAKLEELAYEHREAIDNYERQIEELNAKMKQKEELFEDHIRVANIEHEDALEKQHKEHLAALETLRESLHNERDELAKALEETKTIAHENIQRVAGEARNRIRALETEYKNLQNTAAAAAQAHANTLKELDEKFKMLTEDRDKKEKTIEALKKHVESLDNRHEEQLDTALTTLRNDLSEKFKKEWTLKVKENADNLRKTLQELHDKEKKKLEEEIVKKMTQEKGVSISEHTRQVNSLQSTVDTLKKELDDANRLLAELTNKQSKELNKQYEALKHQLHDEHQATISKMVNEARAEAEKATMLEIEMIVKQHNVFAEDLVQHNQQIIDNLKKEHEEIRKREMVQHVSDRRVLEDKLKELRDKERMLTDSINVARKMQLATNNEHQEQVKSLQEIIEQKKDQIVGFQHREKELHNNIHQLKQEVDDRIAEIEELGRQHEQHLRDKERELQAKHKRELDLISDQNAKEVIKLNQELHSAYTQMEERTAKLEKMLTAAELRYQHREPRPEDLERIQFLERELVEVENLYKKTKDEIKFIKLELQNRDENISKFFNNAPKVGVLNPKERSFSMGSKDAVPKLPPIPNNNTRSPKKETPGRASGGTSPTMQKSSR